MTCGLRQLVSLQRGGNCNDGNHPYRYAAGWVGAVPDSQLCEVRLMACPNFPPTCALYETARTAVSQRAPNFAVSVAPRDAPAPTFDRRGRATMDPARRPSHQCAGKG